MNKEQDISDFEDFAPKSSLTGKHVYLHIIDTPGLDDSDNANEEKTKSDHGLTGNIESRKVDEVHKLAILKALTKVGKIHCACFMLSLDSTLGRAT